MNKYQLYTEHNNITIYGDNINDAVLRANPLPQADEHLRDDQGNWIPKYRSRPALTIIKIIKELNGGTRGANPKHRRLLVELDNKKYYELDLIDYGTI